LAVVVRVQGPTLSLMLDLIQRDRAPFAVVHQAGEERGLSLTLADLEGQISYQILNITPATLGHLHAFDALLADRLSP
jgi:hypothetical protein